MGRETDITDVRVDAAATRALFEERYGRSARWLVAAPGRVNLIGEHTDYNEGYVLPAAIDRRVLIGAAGITQPVIRLYSESLRETVEIVLESELKPGEPRWANYPRGVLAGLRRLGWEVPGFEAVIYSTVPPGGGLSSSAALEVAFATVLEEICARRLNLSEKGLLCQEAEHLFAGVPCGIMDQFAAVFGREDHLMLLDCRSREIRYVGWSDPGVGILVFNTRVHHELADGEYGRRRAACEAAALRLGVSSLRDATMGEVAAAGNGLTEEERRCARHVVSEIRRTVRAAELIEEGEWGEVGELMYESHASLRDDYRVSCAELDFVVEQAQGTAGVMGCRMTGGGFGGCAVALVKASETGRIMEELKGGYREAIKIEPVVFLIRPGEGVQVLGESGDSGRGPGR